jgi:hypothetical protein
MTSPPCRATAWLRFSIRYHPVACQTSRGTSHCRSTVTRRGRRCSSRAGSATRRSSTRARAAWALRGRRRAARRDRRGGGSRRAARLLVVDRRRARHPETAGSRVAFELDPFPAGRASPCASRRGPRLCRKLTFLRRSGTHRARGPRAGRNARRGDRDRARRVDADHAPGGRQAPERPGRRRTRAAAPRRARDPLRPTPEPLGDAIAWMADLGAQWDTRLARLKRSVS